MSLMRLRHCAALIGLCAILEAFEKGQKAYLLNNTQDRS